MVSPDSELRLLSALQISEGTEQEKRRKQKMFADLMQGFRIIRVTPPANHIFVITRFENDLFEMELGANELIHMPDEPTFPSDRFLYRELLISRRKKIWPLPGSAPLESWELHISTDSGQTFTRGHKGILDEEEFWRRYEDSVVDPVATKEYCRYLTLEKDSNFQTTWMSEESAQIQ